MMQEKTDAPEQRELRKGLKITGAVFAVLLLCITAACLVFPQIFYQLFFFGDRVKGTVYVTVDGRPAAVTSLAEADGWRLSGKEENAVLACRADAYGKYDCSFRVGALPDTVFSLWSYQSNEWNVTRFTLYYDVDTEQKLVQYRCTWTELEESGRTSELHRDEGSYPLDGEKHPVCVCPP